MVKNAIDNQRGVILLGLLIFMIFMGMIITSLLTLLAAEARMQIIGIDQKRAQYAAEAGIEYAMRAINEYAVDNSSLLGLHNYTESVATGGGTTCDLKIELIGSDRFKITAIGRGQNFAKVIEKTVEYIDVAQYAVYATGDVRYVNVTPSSRVKKNATYMPLFDLDDLRDQAKPSQYYPVDLTINSWYTFNRDVTFVERDLTFRTFSWIALNRGDFAVGRNIRVRFSGTLFGIMDGNMYQFNPGSQFVCEAQWLWRSLRGSIITDGDVIGTTNPGWFFRFRVYYDRNRMNKFLSSSVNGGPLIYKVIDLNIK